MEEEIAKAGNRINLNVGGERFSTSKDTLVSMEGTYFYAMLSSDRWKPDGEGKEQVEFKEQESILSIVIRNILDAF